MEKEKHTCVRAKLYVDDDLFSLGYYWIISFFWFSRLNNEPRICLGEYFNVLSWKKYLLQSL